VAHLHYVPPSSWSTDPSESVGYGAPLGYEFALPASPDTDAVEFPVVHLYSVPPSSWSTAPSESVGYGSHLGYEFAPPAAPATDAGRFAPGQLSSIPSSTWSATPYHHPQTNPMASAASVGYAELPLTKVSYEQLIWKGKDTPLTPPLRSAIKKSLGKSTWGMPIYLAKHLYLAHFWVSLANPWVLSDDQCRPIITKCFLTAIDLTGITWQQLHDRPRERLLRVTIII
jgi:hypothetical protein